MKKIEIIREMAEAAKITQKQADAAFEAVFNAISRGIEETGRVAVPGFGVFIKTERPARKGRHPQTGEEIMIEAKKVIRFRQSRTSAE